MQEQRNHWWLLAVCGVLNAALWAACSFMQAPDGSFVWRHAAVRGTAELLGQLALASGAGTVVAAVWRRERRAGWPLMGNGLALIALGLLFLGVAGGRVSFRAIAGLLVVMAISMGVRMLTTTGEQSRGRASRWVNRLACAGAISFAAAFLWMKPVPETHSEILWIGSYFGYQAACLFWLAWRARGSHAPQHGDWTVGPTAATGQV
ncbi:MAG: hypothetical protein J0H49_24735 [Acidobacteria bacterium]|nr:hypothetical protein [Acidobacteriota bacterium]